MKKARRDGGTGARRGNPRVPRASEPEVPEIVPSTLGVFASSWIGLIATSVWFECASRCAWVMKLLVGLGNPEGRYAKTRHNAGFMVIDRLLGKFGGGEPLKARFNSACAEASVAGERVLFMKPTTYMNRSGQAVGEAVRFFKINASGDLLVITDDIYLPVGVIRLKPGGGTGGHNGLDDIHRALGSDAYPRLRVGVGMRPNGGKPAYMDQADFVLQGFTSEDQPDVEASLDRAAQACEAFITKGLPAAMNAFNSKSESIN